MIAPLKETDQEFLSRTGLKAFHGVEIQHQDPRLSMPIMLELRSGLPTGTVIRHTENAQRFQEIRDHYEKYLGPVSLKFHNVP